MFDQICAALWWIGFDVHWGPHHWPAFSMADIGITVDAALIVTHEFFGQKTASIRSYSGTTCLRNQV